jgi:4'-phosphopantetheinyl transferase EntD
LAGSTDALVGSLASILPNGVEADEVTHLSSEGLLATEQAFTAKFAPSRLADFTCGRSCARRAIAGLGVPDADQCAIPIGVHGQPVWPPGVVGSIAHCPGRWAAAAAPSDRYGSIGIDVEVRTHLPPPIVEVTSRPSELVRLEADPRVEWPLVLFSAREAVFKCWSPVVGARLDRLDLEVTLDAAARTFVARPTVPMSPKGRRVLSSLVGSFTWTAEHVSTAAWLPRDFASDVDRRAPTD